MSQAVRSYSDQPLPDEDPAVLDEQFAQLAEAEWKLEAEDARRIAPQKGIDQATIDAAVEKVRYG